MNTTLYSDQQVVQEINQVSDYNENTTLSLGTSQEIISKEDNQEVSEMETTLQTEIVQEMIVKTESNETLTEDEVTDASEQPSEISTNQSIAPSIDGEISTETAQGPVTEETIEMQASTELTEEPVDDGEEITELVEIVMTTIENLVLKETEEENEATEVITEKTLPIKPIPEVTTEAELPIISLNPADITKKPPTDNKLITNEPVEQKIETETNYLGLYITLLCICGLLAVFLVYLAIKHKWGRRIFPKSSPNVPLSHKLRTGRPSTARNSDKEDLVQSHHEMQEVA